jgi:hypothetical protein
VAAVFATSQCLQEVGFSHVTICLALPNAY